MKVISAATPNGATGRQDATGGGGDGGSPSAQPKTKAKSPCKFFLTDKGCSKGGSCAYSHAFTRTSEPHEPQAGEPSEPHEPQAGEPSEPHEPQAEEPSEPHEPQAGEPSEPHEPQAGEPSEPHEPQAGEPVVSDHFSRLDSGGPGLLDEVLGGIGDVFPGDSAGDPMEEIPDKRMPSRTRNDECLWGLSEEEFKRLFDEVGMAKHFQTIYLVQPLRTRTAAEVTAAVQQTVLRLKAEGLRISRIHADRARELRVESIKCWALERGIFCTFAEGQAPQSNGRAESAVKWVKSSVRKLLAATDLPKETWAVAAHYATQDRMERMLRRSSSMLPFGTKVHVRSKVYGTGGKYDLDSRWKAGRYVGPSLEVNGGHMIRFENGAYMTSTHLRPHLVHPDTVVDLEEYEVLLPVPTRRLKIKAGGRDADGSSEHEAISLEYDPEHPAEQHAMRLLEDSDNLTPDQLENLAIMLPSTAPTPKRFGPQRDSQKVWTAGAFVHGGVIGVKTASTRVFIKYVNQLEPGHHFNAVAVTTDIEAKQHVDAHNVGMNLVAGLSYFKGGALVVEGPEEERVLSLDGDTAHQVFDPKFQAFHKALVWWFANRLDRLLSQRQWKPEGASCEVPQGSRL